MTSKAHLIWDLPLRLFHWSFASSILLLWLTSELGSDYIDWHITLGYCVLTLTIFRIAWGFFGPKHAKFSHFLPTPTEIVSYLKQQNTPQAKVYAGHNPIGSLMVIAMLILVLIQAVSGLFVDDQVFSSGPYFNAAGDTVDKLMSTVHHTMFDFILLAIALHIAAIIFYKTVKKQNLVKAMFTGKKADKGITEKDAIKHSKLWLALIIIALCCAFVYWLVVMNPPPVEEFYY